MPSGPSVQSPPLWFGYGWSITNSTRSASTSNVPSAATGYSSTCVFAVVGGVVDVRGVPSGRRRGRAGPARRRRRLGEVAMSAPRSARRRATRHDHARLADDVEGVVAGAHGEADRLSARRPAASVTTGRRTTGAGAAGGGGGGCRRSAARWSVAADDGGDVAGRRCADARPADVSAGRGVDRHVASRRRRRHRRRRRCTPRRATISAAPTTTRHRLVPSVTRATRISPPGRR